MPFYPRNYHFLKKNLDLHIAFHLWMQEYMMRSRKFSRLPGIKLSENEVGKGWYRVPETSCWRLKVQFNYLTFGYCLDHLLTACTCVWTYGLPKNNQAELGIVTKFVQGVSLMTTDIRKEIKTGEILVF